MFRVRPLAAFLCLTFVLCALVLRSVSSQQGGLRRITNTTEEGLNLNPSLSGDGRRIAFESTEDVARAGGTDHFRAIRADVSVDPPTFVQMAGTRAVSPAISQDGSRVAFASMDNPLGTNQDGNSEIFLYDGTTLRQLTNTSPGSAVDRVRNGNFLPSISDDGRFIAFSSNRDLITGLNQDANLEIFVYDANTQAFTQLTATIGTVGASYAKISGNGARIAYIRDTGATASAQRDLVLQDRNGGATLVAAANVSGLALTYGRAISDDGTRVVYAAETATPNSTQVFLFDGRSLNLIRPITFLGARATDVPLHPTISGDGSRIAFATRRTVLPEDGGSSVDLYTFDIPTGQYARVTNTLQTTTEVAATPSAEVVSSLNDDGTSVAFNFPRLLSGGVAFPELCNNSEIYLTQTTVRAPFGNLTVLNGASFGSEPSPTKAVAPNSIAVGLGGALATTTEQSQRQPDGSFPRNVGGTTVTVNGRAAQIFFVSPAQVNFLVPPETEVGTAEVVVTASDGFQTKGSVTILRAAPGVFTYSGDGRGEGVILDADALTPGPFDPSNGQRRLIICATGVRNATQVVVTIGGRAVTVESIVDGTRLPGLDEIHILLPADLRGAGKVELFVRADGRDSNPVDIVITGEPRRDLVINEVLADPPDTDGDANHDGVRDSTQDEFVEIVNASANDINIGNYELLARGASGSQFTLRHRFAAGTILPAGGAIIVFGGGGPNFDPNNAAFGGAQVVKASTGSLSLVNSGGVVMLREPAGAVASLFSYGGSTNLNADQNQSLTRSPDITGGFTGHLSAAGNGGRAYSPGTQVNGQPFLSPAIARIEVSPPSAALFVGQRQQFTATAYDVSSNPMSGVIFFWQTSNASVVTIDQTGLAMGVAEGTAEIRAFARGVQSAPASVTVSPVTRVLTRIEVTPPTASTPVSGTQQFTARALDQFDNEMTGVTFAWSSSDTNIATIDPVTGLATGVSQGSVTITASAQGTGGTATLNVTAPTILINEVLADPPDTDGDANHDGTRDSSEDEFVELVNSTSAAINISGWTIRTRTLTGTTETTQHTFAAGTSLPAGEAIVVFGGGGPNFDPNNAAFGCAQVVKASTNNLSLTNSALTIIVRNSSGNVVTQFTYGGTTGLGGDQNQSLTRSPDITGGFVLHTAAVGAAGRRFSPGTRANGTPFGTCAPRLTSITISPPSANVVIGQSTQFTAQAFDQFGNPFVGATITFASDNTGVATVDSVTPNPATGSATASVTGQAQGTAHITAQATSGTTTVTSTQATLTVNTVATTYSVSGQVRDSSNNPVSGVLITFELNSMGTLTTRTVQTDANGNYASGDLGCQNSVKVTPSKSGFIFSPLSIVFTSTQCLTGSDTANFTAAPAPPGTLVISQLYVGGGNAGATYTNDYVEIFNSGTTTVDFSATPYSIQYVGIGGSFGSTATSNKTNITSGTIAPGQYFLVREASGGAIGGALPTADATGSINMAAAGGKVALVVGTAALPASTCPGDDGSSPFIPTNPTIADFVGYGSSATTAGHCYEGPGPAPAPSSTNADFRKAGGCVDTNFNADDFLLGTPNPRNTASPFNDCSAGLKPDITINDPSSVAESAASVTFTVTLSTPSTLTVTVNYSTADGTATAGSDYTATNGTLTFAPGETTKTISVPVINDTTDEPSETFFVNLSNATNALILDNQGQGTITDNDAAPVISVNDVSVTEGDTGTTNADFTVTLSAASGFTVTVNYSTTDGTAAAGTDYQSATGTVTFNLGQTTQTVTVLVNGDTTFEPNETFFVNLASPANATISDNQGQGTITNDDAAPPVPAFSINDPSVTEGDSGTKTLVFTVTLSLNPSQPASVDYSTANGTATAGSDYQTTSGTLTFNPGDPLTKTISVTVNGDTLFEPDETLFVNLSNASANSIITDNQGTGTITNDDAANLVISQVYGGGGNTGATYQNDFVEIFNRGTTTINFAVTPYSIQYASASAGGTFSTSNKTNITSGTIAPGQHFLVQEASSGIAGAALPTPDATGNITMAATSGKVALVLGTTVLPASTCPGDDGSSPFNPSDSIIADFVGYGGNANTTGHCYEGTGPAASLDATTADFRKAGGCLDTNQNATDFIDGTPSPRNTASPFNDCSAGFRPEMTINDRALSEGTSLANFTVTLSTPSTLTVTVDYSTANGTATAGSDYTAASGTLTFAPGETTKTINITIINDLLDEANETYFVNLSNATNATILDAQGQGTINDNDAAPTISINDASIAEGDSGTKTLDFTVSLSAVSGQTVAVDYATADNTATVADNDYQSATGTLTFNPGDTAKTISVTINGDTNVEPNETFFVNLTNAANATILDNQGQGTIQDDDAPPNLSINDVALSEGNAGTTTFTFTVSLSGPAKTGGVTFTVNTADGTTNPATAGSDYVAIVNGSGSIAEGGTSTTVSVTVNGDTTFEPNETFFVDITSVSGATVTDGQGLGTINNDDAQPTLTIADAAVTEGNSGTSLMTFTVTLTGTSQSTVSVNYATADSSATVAGADYDSASGTLNFAPGDPTETFTVTIHGDTNAEGDEMFFVNLSGASGATISDSQALGTIFLDDPLSIASLNTAYTENFDILAQSGVSSTTPAAWTRAETGTTANFTYAANDGSSTTGDTYSYGTTGSAERALGGLRTGSLVPTVGAFYRNDTGLPINTLQLAYTGEQWRLGSAGRTDRLDFQYSTNATSLTTGTWTDADALDFTTPNTATTGSKDGNNAANRTALTSTITALSIAPGATFWIRWTDFDATGSDDGLAVDDFSLTAGINTPALSIDDVSHAEGNTGTTTTYTFTVSLSSVAGPGGVTFDIATADNTATTADNDYVARSLTGQTIPAGQQTYTFDVTVNGDANVESTETFNVNVTSVSGATITDSQGTGTITNDDAAASSANLSLTKTVNNSTPNIGERVVFTVTLNNAGPDSATGVQVTDLLPSGLAFVSSTPSQGTYTSATGIWNVGTVSVGSPAATLTITATVTTTGAKLNTAQVTASGTPDPNSTPNDGTGDDFASVTVTGASNLVINEIHTQAQSSPPADANDFVELYNKSSQAIDISGLVISYRGTTSTTTVNTFTLPASTVIPANGYLIIVNGATTYGVAADFNASGGAGFNLTATSGGVKIELNGVKLDGVAYQSSAANTIPATFAAFGEGTPFTSPVASGQQDYVRSPNGADSNDNATDFRRSGANSTTVTPKAANPTITP